MSSPIFLQNNHKNMDKITQSASKLVFLIMAVALVGLTAFKIVEAKDFIVLCSMAFTYYFTRDKGQKTV